MDSLDRPKSDHLLENAGPPSNEEALSVKIRAWCILDLPLFWFRHLLVFELRRRHVYARASEMALHMINAAIYLRDPKCALAALHTPAFDGFPEKWQAQLFIHGGLALYDLGCRDEGVQYVERGIRSASECQTCTSGTVTTAEHLLLYRLNEERFWKKRLEYATRMVERYPDDEHARTILAKACIDLGQHQRARVLLKTLVDNDPKYHIFVADLCFQAGDYEAAAALFDKYTLADGEDWWYAQFDYKKAVAYFKTGEEKKWRRQAKEIGHRAAWDRFYGLDYIVSEGVDRIADIDAEIAKWTDKRRFDPVRMRRIATRLPHTLWCIACMYRYPLLYFVAGTLSCGALLYRLILELCRAL